MLPSIPSLEKICNAFGITLSQFFAEDQQFTLTDTQNQLIEASGHLTEEQMLSLITFLNSL